MIAGYTTARGNERKIPRCDTKSTISVPTCSHRRATVLVDDDPAISHKHLRCGHAAISPALARRKGVRRVVLADAMNLPFDDASFDCVTIAFGLRNLESCSAALTEMRRVLNAKGHLLVLEFSLPTAPILRALYRFYLHRCLPMLGSFLTHKKSAYDYLGDSIEGFPNGNAMCELMRETGYVEPRFEPLTGGIVTIYTATKS